MSEDKRYRDEQWLRQQYVAERKTTPEIADLCGCSYSTVAYWLDKLEIETRCASGFYKDAKHRDEEYLREKYHGEKMTIYEIADECGCTNGTISNWLSKHGIETREAKTQPENVAPDQRLTDADWLREKYIESRMTTESIAGECGCSSSSVFYWLERHGIDTRSSGRMPADSRLADRKWLREQYVDEKLTCEEIAAECGCNSSNISDWLQKHAIETREGTLIGADHPNWNGGPTPYGAGWNDSKKRLVRKRDNHTCRDSSCSVTQADHLDEYGEKLHVHHLRKARDIDDAQERNCVENLITLCRDCHRRWEKIADAGLVPEVVADD